MHQPKRIHHRQPRRKQGSQAHALPDCSSKQMHLPSLVTKPLVQPSNFAFGSPTKRPQIRTPPQESKDLSLTRVCLSHINRGGAKAQLKHPIPSATAGASRRAQTKRGVTRTIHEKRRYPSRLLKWSERYYGKRSSQRTKAAEPAKTPK